MVCVLVLVCEPTIVISARAGTRTLTLNYELWWRGTPYNPQTMNEVCGEAEGAGGAQGQGRGMRYAEQRWRFWILATPHCEAGVPAPLWPLATADANAVSCAPVFVAYWMCFIYVCVCTEYNV